MRLAKCGQDAMTCRRLIGVEGAVNIKVVRVDRIVEDHCIRDSLGCGETFGVDVAPNLYGSVSLRHYLV